MCILRQECEPSPFPPRPDVIRSASMCREKPHATPGRACSAHALVVQGRACKYLQSQAKQSGTTVAARLPWGVVLPEWTQLKGSAF